jgi:hypothetical protein
LEKAKIFEGSLTLEKQADRLQNILTYLKKSDKIIPIG